MGVDATAQEREVVVRTLRAAGCVFAEDEAWLILRESGSTEQVEEMVRNRCSGLPLEQVVGFAEFCGLRVHLEPGVFVPRRRTELLVRTAVAVTTPGDRALDLCCGSGAVGMALDAALPGAQIHASDIEPAAVRCARHNLEPLGGQVFEGDLFDALPASLRGELATVVVNAPYVPTDAIATMPPEARDHEPRVALDGGPDGVDLHRRVAAHAAEWLTPSGHLLVETSPGQAALTVAAFRAGGLSARIVTAPDVDGTVVIGSAAGSA